MSEQAKIKPLPVGSPDGKMRGRVSRIEYWPDGAVMFATGWLQDSPFLVTFYGERPPMSVTGCRIEAVGQRGTAGDVPVIFATSCSVVDDDGNATPVECEPCQEER